MQYTIRPKAELPPDPKDKYAAIATAFGQLTGSEVLFVEPDKTDGAASARSIGDRQAHREGRYRAAQGRRGRRRLAGTETPTRRKRRKRRHGPFRPPAPVVRRCTRPGCGGRMMADRLNQGEWNCVSCGAVQYGEGFTPVSREADPVGRYALRGARFDGAKL